MLMLREGGKKICSSHIAQRKSSRGISNILPFSGDVCLLKILGSSRLGQSIGMRLVFMLKEPCDAISIHEEYWEGKILMSRLHTCQLSLSKIFTALFVPESCLKLVPKKIIMAITVGVMCPD